MEPKRIPNFILGGSSPAGTGHLYQLLLQHPDIYLPVPMSPECNFFSKSREYEKGFDHYLDRWFSKTDGKPCVGERSSHLISGSETVVSRLKTHLPDVKLIFLLRNPVDRAWAHYRFTTFAGFDDLDFQKALDLESERLEKESLFWREVHRYAYFKRGLFAEELTRFLAEYPKNQILILKSNSLVKNQQETMNRIFSFLQVKSMESLEDCGELPTPWVMNPRTQADLRHFYPMEFDHALQRIREQLEPRNECEKLMYDNVTFDRPSIAEKTQEELYRRYQKPNEALKPLIDFDIEEWFR